MLDLAERISRDSPCPTILDLRGTPSHRWHSAQAGVDCTIEHSEPCTAKPRLPQSSSETDALRCIVLIRLHDESGLRQLHAAYSTQVFACAMRIVGRKELADEIVSTSFMQVWTNAASYDERRGPVVAWLLLIVRSRAIDAVRHAKLLWSRELSVDEDDDSCAELAGAAIDEPPAHLERLTSERRLHRALLRLSPMQRQVLSLTTLDGLSQDEASRHLDLPLGTVKSHARRGLAALRARCEAIGLTAS